MPQQERISRSRPTRSSLGQAVAFGSSAFDDGARIPRRYAAEGASISPPLDWSEGPEGTRSFAIVCEDIDAPLGPFVHWIAFNIAGDERALPENASVGASGLSQGVNGFGERGYAGPKPPLGWTHRYVFHIYALDSMLELPRGAARADLDRAIDGHLLAVGAFSGSYASATRPSDGSSTPRS